MVRLLFRFLAASLNGRETRTLSFRFRQDMTGHNTIYETGLASPPLVLDNHWRHLKKVDRLPGKLLTSHMSTGSP
ncbi:hypothetical protein C8J56DRAFT_981390 [Mycena floridula]|nr:hypothetical protein C8J56DRAFT_981390 [Mycena floridula]